ncbi:DUF4328 domain-containing protein [Schumannella luteola]
MTSDATPLPPAGWYPSPTGSGAQAWWDGAQWQLDRTPEVLPSLPPAPDHSIPKLAGAIQVLLIIAGVAYLATVVTELFGITAATRYLGGDASAVALLTIYDQVTLVVSVLTALLLIATGIVWVVWQFRVARQLPGRTRRSPGWHAGSWFIPFVNWFFPYQNVSDLWTAVGRPRPSWLLLWWLLWVIGNAVLGISGRVYQYADSLEGYLASMVLGLIGDILMIAAAPLAVLVVRGITAGLLSGGASATAPVAQS